MRRRTISARITRALVAALGVALVLTCGSPSKPSSPPPSGTPGPPTVSTLRIEGPTSIAPGASAQFRLIAAFADGSTADVASQATWTSDNTSVLSFSAGGLANAGVRGEAHISAQYQSQTRHGGALVLEDGTFRLGGRVSESGGGLPGATVEVIAGTGTGLTATTATNGSFALYGVAGDVEVEARLNGFENGRRTIAVTTHSTVDLELRPSGEPADLRGDWRLTLTASAGCSPAAPADVSPRTYNVTIAQTGTALQVDVHGVPLATAGFKLTGAVVLDRVTISVPFSDYYYGFRYYAIVEMLQPGRLVGISGTAGGELQGTSITGSFDGHFALYGVESSGGVRSQLYACYRTDHGFRLDRN